MCDTTTVTAAVPVTATATEDTPFPHIPLEPVEAVTITTLVDNVSDMLAVDKGPAKRPFTGDAPRVPSPMFEEGWVPQAPIAEHGFSALVTVQRAGQTHRILFDAGLSP